MEDFVPFEIAKKLKEKGFKEKCLTYYDVIDNVGLLYNTQYTNDLSPCQYTDLLQSHNTDVNTYQSDDSEYCVDAPAISQVLKWLIDEKKLFVYPYTVQLPEDERLGEGSGKRMWDFSVDDLNIDDCIFESLLKYHSYEEAAMAGIEYVINNLI